LLRTIVANNERPITAHDFAATAADHALPHHVHGAIRHRGAAVRHRAKDYQRWRAATATLDDPARAAQHRDIGADRSIDDGREL